MTVLTSLETPEAQTLCIYDRRTPNAMVVRDEPHSEAAASTSREPPWNFGDTILDPCPFTGSTKTFFP